MQTPVRGLTEQNILDTSAYLASLKP
jgi:hypothetical protein